MATLNATAVIPLTDRNVEFLKKMQLNHEIPEDAKYIAFLEDGDATFLFEELSTFGPTGVLMPKMFMITYYENIAIEFE